MSGKLNGLLVISLSVAFLGTKIAVDSILEKADKRKVKRGRAETVMILNPTDDLILDLAKLARESLDAIHTKMAASQTGSYTFEDLDSEAKHDEEDKRAA